MSICDYGCGNAASYQLKSGKNCCSKSPTSCPEVRRKNSESKKGINPWENREHPRAMKGKTAWNKGLTKQTDKRVKANGKAIKSSRKENPETSGWSKNHKHTEDTKARISKRMKEIGAGGYREGSGRGNKGRYKGIYCDSSWELAFILWCDLKGYQVKRARKKFSYQWEGKERKYLPDFRYKGSSGTWKYLEIKGYRTDQWKAKKKAFPHELLFIGKRIITNHILPLVYENYGKDFIRLYE